VLPSRLRLVKLKRKKRMVRTQKLGLETSLVQLQSYRCIFFNYEVRLSHRSIRVTTAGHTLVYATNNLGPRRATGPSGPAASPPPLVSRIASCRAGSQHAFFIQLHYSDTCGRILPLSRSMRTEYKKEKKEK
jgi:hypothetical protein